MRKSLQQIVVKPFKLSPPNNQSEKGNESNWK
jgi:hypothetical protein